MITYLCSMEVNGFENYIIYPDGRVFSKKNNIFLKTYEIKGGYERVKLDGIWKQISRLVAENYINNIDDKPCVDHINRNPKDNRVENLRWVTRKENQSNRSVPTNNTTGFKWINKYPERNGYRFMRNNCKTRKSKDISKLLCYSFFYMLKHPMI